MSFAALLLAMPVAGLDPGTALTQYGHTAWRVREGFFAGPPSAIAQTRDGFLWIGTETGLIRFDGVRFTPWQPPKGSHLPDDRIVKLLGASDGSLWIGTANGLAQWRAPNLVTQAPTGRFGALLEDHRGTVWAGHTRALGVPSLCRAVSGDFRCFGFPDEVGLRFVRALHEDRQGNLWLGGDRGVCRWKPETPASPECYPIGSPAQAMDEDYAVEVLAEDSGGTLWAGTKAHGIWWRVAGRWTRYPNPPDPGLEAQGMLSDREGGLWMGTLSHGLLRIAPGRTERLTRTDGLSGDAVNDVFEDREGSLWVATTAGLDRFREVKVTTLTAQEGLGGGDVGAVVASRDGSLWIAERRVLIHLGPTGMSSYKADKDLPGSSPTSLFEDSRGRLWVGVEDGLAWWEHGRFFPLKMPDGSAVGLVRAMAEDRDGNLWLATIDPSRPLVRVRDERVVEVVSAQQIGGDQVRAIAADPQGGVWLGIEAELKHYYNGRVEARANVGGPSRRRIFNLLPDVRGLWVVTNRGLDLLRHGTLSTLGTRNGLPCDSTEDAVWSGDGALWLKTACGLVRIPAGELDAWLGQPERRLRVSVLDAFEGAQPGLSPFTPRSARSLDGRLWFAIEEGGLQVVDPGKTTGNRIPPPVQILRVVADRKGYEQAPGLRLPPLTRDLEIDYTALSLIIPEKVRFRYRLAGAGGDWQDAGTRREAFFTNLRPGSYRFSVVACNNDGVWNEKGATLAFTVLPAFYQTRGFFLLCVAASAFLMWAAYRWRLRQVAARLDLQFQERLEERTRIAQDLHDTLLQGVLSASMQFHVAIDGIPADAPEKPLLSRALQLLAMVIEEGRNAVRGLRAPASQPPGADDLAQALSRIPQELGLQEPGGFRVVVEGPPQPLRPLIRDEVYRISREALINAFRHSGAAEMEVEIEFTRRALRVLVRDDGRGIDPEVLRAGREGHWGLSGMRERAERVGAQLRVWSRVGAGTEVELSVPAEIAFHRGARCNEPAGRRAEE